MALAIRSGNAELSALKKRQEGGGPLCLGLYHSSIPESHWTRERILSYAGYGLGGSPDGDAGAGRLIALHLLPERWRFLEPAAFASAKHIGVVSFHVVRNWGQAVAYTDDYRPKEHIMKHVAPGLGYFTEWLLFDALRGEITHVSTSVGLGYADGPNMLRRGQLESVGLPVRQKVPVDEWLAGMLRGVRRSRGRELQELARKGASQQGF